MGNAKSSTKDAHESGWGADLSCVDCSTDANNERVQFVKLHRENERARHTKIDRVMESAETEMKWQEVTRTVRDNKQVLVPVARSPGKPSEDKSVWDEMCSEGGCGCGTEPHQYAAMMTSTTPDIEVSNSPTRDKVMDSFEKEAAWHEIRKTVSPPPQQRTAPMGRSSTMGHRAVHTPEQRGMGRQRGNHSNSPELLMLAHPELVRQASEPIHAQQHGHAQPARVSASAGVSPMNQTTVGRRTSEDYGPGMSQASQDFGPGMSQASVGRRNSQDFGPGIGLAQFGRRNPQDYGAGSPMPARPQSHVSPQPVSAPRRYHRPNPDVIQPALDAQSIREVEREQYRAWFDAKQGTTTHNTADSFEDLKRNHGHASSTLAVVNMIKTKEQQIRAQKDVREKIEGDFFNPHKGVSSVIHTKSKNRTHDTRNPVEHIDSLTVVEIAHGGKAGEHQYTSPVSERIKPPPIDDERNRPRQDEVFDMDAWRKVQKQRAAFQTKYQDRS